MSISCCGLDEATSGIPEFPLDTEIPVKNRKQTDLIYFVILVILFLFLVISVIVAASQGDIRRLTHEYDDKGNLCGFKNEPIEGVSGSGLDQTENKYLQTSTFCRNRNPEIFDYVEVCETEKKCVSKCKEGYTPSITSLCIKNSENITDDTTGTLFMEFVYSDLSVCWREILALCFGSICLSGLVLTLLRLYPRIVIRVLIAIIIIAAIGLMIFGWTMVSLNSIAKDKATGDEKIALTTQMIQWLIFVLVFSLFMGIFFFLLYKARDKLKLLAVLFQEGGKCIKDIPTLLLQPILTHLITIVFACFMWTGLAYVITSGKAEIDDEGKVYFPINTFFQITCWLLAIVFLWLCQFFLASQHLVIAGAVSSWYFSRIKGKLDSPVWRSFCMIVKNHLGSAALGSLILTIVKIFRSFIRSLERRSRENVIMALIWGVLRCCLSWIAAILKILNKSAYIMIVLFGDPFCKSASRAFACLTSESSKIIIIIGVGSFLLTTIEFLVAVTTTFVGVAIFMGIDEINIIWIPILVVFSLSFLCSHCIFAVYEMTVDTLILCFCVDHQMNDGLEKPYYMNENLKIFFDDKNRVGVTPDQGKDQDLLLKASSA